MYMYLFVYNNLRSLETIGVVDSLTIRGLAHM